MSSYFFSMSMAAFAFSAAMSFLPALQGIQGSPVREPGDLEAALRRGVDAITAGEPCVLDVRVATGGTGAESTWHQRFKLRR